MLPANNVVVKRDGAGELLKLIDILELKDGLVEGEVALPSIQRQTRKKMQDMLGVLRSFVEMFDDPNTLLGRELNCIQTAYHNAVRNLQRAILLDPDVANNELYRNHYKITTQAVGDSRRTAGPQLYEGSWLTTLYASPYGLESVQKICLGIRNFLKYRRDVLVNRDYNFLESQRRVLEHNPGPERDSAHHRNFGTDWARDHIEDLNRLRDAHNGRFPEFHKQLQPLDQMVYNYFQELLMAKLQGMEPPPNYANFPCRPWGVPDGPNVRSAHRTGRKPHTEVMAFCARDRMCGENRLIIPESEMGRRGTANRKDSRMTVMSHKKAF